MLRQLNHCPWAFGDQVASYSPLLTPSCLAFFPSSLTPSPTPPFPTSSSPGANLGHLPGRAGMHQILVRYDFRKDPKLRRQPT